MAMENFLGKQEHIVIPAKAGIQGSRFGRRRHRVIWIPAFAHCCPGFFV